MTSPGAGIRVAEVSDLGELVRLRELEIQDLQAERDGDLWWAIDGPPSDGSDLANAVDDDDALVVLGLLDEVPVGFTSAARRSTRDGQALAVVSDLYVEVPARELGVGEAMMDAVINWARSQACTGIDATVLPGSREAKTFFERNGL